MQRIASLLKHFLAKLLLDALAAALASAIGGYLLAHYQLSHSAAPTPSAAQASPTSAEIVKLVRDEHALIAGFLKTRATAERRRLATQDGISTRAEADAQPTSVASAAHRIAAATVAVKSMPPPRPAATATPAARAPFAIAQVAGNDAAESSSRPSETLLARTINLKDHVIAATQHVVAVIGDLPSWIASSVSMRVGGQTGSTPSAGHLVSASS